MRLCACKRPIEPTNRVRRFGAARGKDPKVWPTKCSACILDSVIDMFEETVSTSEPRCALCGDTLGPKFYSSVPDIGDLCLRCHANEFSTPR
jgi:hypothetical protein